MNTEELEEKYKKLQHDLLDLCESYQNELLPHELGFGVIRFISQASNEGVARRTILIATEEGFRIHKEGNPHA